MPSLLLRPTKVVNITGIANNFNLFSNVAASYPLNVICLINANIGSTTNTIPAFVTGNGWSTGTWIYIDNNATIRGANGSNGSAGSAGANGAGGAGGASAAAPGNPGTAGGPASNGSNGSAGSSGGIAFRADIISGVSISLDNAGGTIIKGFGGAGGPGGPGGTGGGGGGGGGGGA